MIDLDIGFEEFELDKVPDVARGLLAEFQQQDQRAAG
jgi:hypothetical protein